jgi:hypothetical protein
MDSQLLQGHSKSNAHVMTRYLGDGAIPAAAWAAAALFVAWDGGDDVIDLGCGENGVDCEGIHLGAYGRCE